MRAVQCKICGKKFKKTKSRKPSAWLKNHFLKDGKHIDAIIPPGLVFETAGELDYWITLRLQNTKTSRAKLREKYEL